MTPERWREVEEVYNSTMEREPALRSAYLAEACGDDEDLRREVESLVAQTSATALVDQPALQAIADLLDTTTSQTAGHNSGPNREVSDIVGLTVGHFRVLEKIGSGGMGIVYKARDLTLDRFVALKFLSPALNQHESAFARLILEAKAASSLDHPNVCTIYEVSHTSEGQVFIAMGFYEGETLSQRLHRGPLPAREAVNIATQVAQGLARAHRHGVIHRDIKPANIMLTAEGPVKILDFGVAKFSESLSLTGAGTAAGTMAYMAPEQLRGDEVDLRADIWSWGVTLYQMLTGRLPFREERKGSLMDGILHEQPDLSSLSSGLVRILTRALEKDAGRRYQQMADVLTDLGSLSELQIPSTPDSESTSGHVALRRRATRRLPWIIAAAVLLITTVVTVPSIRKAILLGLPVRETVSTSRASGRKFIAVLPFSVAGDQALQYVATGIVDDLSARLSRMPDIYLASRVASARVNPRDPIDEVARNLGVKLLVQGAVRGIGDQIAVVVSLDQPSSGRRLWFQDFSGAVDDMATLQNQIYDGLVGVLGPNTTGLGAYEIYLKALTLAQSAVVNEETLKQALSLFDEATQKDSRFVLAFTAKADTATRLYLVTKDANYMDRALNAAARARAIDAGSPEVHFSLGRVYAVVGKTAEAVAELKHALALAPNSDEGYRQLGDIYMKSGQKTEALDTLQQGVDANPNYWPNYYTLGTAYNKFGDNERALDSFKRVTELAPNIPQGWMSVGSVSFHLGNWNDSIAAFKSAVDIKPSVPAYLNLGTSYFFLGAYNDARTNFEKAVDMSPQRGDLVGNLADCYRALGQRDMANMTYDRAITLTLQSLQANPRDAMALSNLGLFYAKKGETAKALDFIRRARDVNPTDVNLFYKDAVINALANRMPKALQNLREALTKGYSVREALNDPDLKALREGPEFEKIVKPFQPKAGS
jgi:eukaryotic-like serine/threonine-protein kinase